MLEMNTRGLSNIFQSNYLQCQSILVRHPKYLYTNFKQVKHDTRLHRFLYNNLNLILFYTKVEIYLSITLHRYFK